MTDRDRPSLPERLVALSEVLLCSGFPTQLAIGGTLAAFGYGAFDRSGRLSIRYVVGLSLLDAAAVIALVFAFLSVHGERPRDVLVGDRPVAREAAVGVALI